ncbi:hypothetical protein LU699_13180 [Luteimonas fraxinea]|uniref:Uncharacterized protein n=1 Tax=Luteimonas fraxinea TaxID=2901869 RepID=A0ABS8UEV5_9GAMM|nr:hypothetical protein [Luteimonas fraxinea]MCD9098033.1 hypothetical protein [Luteimonas fraxinea]UHH09242.1 hypothetical protein LU699_13180 [Luteimonas fraxinea]
MLIRAADVDVPIGNLGSDAFWLDDFSGEQQVGLTVLPDLPLEALELVVDVAACGPPSESEWLEKCESLNSDLSVGQLTDLSLWASGLMPDFGLPSQAHAGLFARGGLGALRTRLGAPDPMPWSYEVVTWPGEEGRHICVVAVQRKFLEAKARVSDVFVRPVSVFSSSEARAASRRLEELVEKLLEATISHRKASIEE